MTLKLWAFDTGVRATKTFAQSLVALFGANAVDVMHTDWKVDLSVAAGAAVVSVLQNVQTLPTPATVAPAAPAPTETAPAAPAAAPVAEPVPTTAPDIPPAVV
jgi:hypothetical protein